MLRRQMLMSVRSSWSADNTGCRARVVIDCALSSHSRNFGESVRRLQKQPGTVEFAVTKPISLDSI